MIREEKIEFTAKWCKYDKYIIEKNDEKIVRDIKNLLRQKSDWFRF